MRKIAAGLFITLDGVVENPGAWQQPYFSPDAAQEMAESMAQQAGMLLGRRTYEEFAASWPHSDLPNAAHMNSVRKYVVSTTLEKADWQNSTLVAPDQIGQLREEGLIQVVGSPTLVRWMLRNDLVDELGLIVCPVTVGAGRRLFEGDEFAFALEEAKPYASGAVRLTYRRANQVT
ncbi:dihydrofolate reductase family protein [Thermoactinospora rubra]|uniref:dihydrofolate reductase family protein n=1 Tax=Thermoactinospora rubra TaxID=1088767 RepID=UPI000A10E63A|nr:dihydrofolate reductase family protein [Thermoactinospora rubra]